MHGFIANWPYGGELSFSATASCRLGFSWARSAPTGARLRHQRPRPDAPDKGNAMSPEALTNELVEPNRFWPRDLDHAIQWRARRDLGHRTRDVIGRHRLNEYGCKANPVA